MRGGQAEDDAKNWFNEMLDVQFNEFSNACKGLSEDQKNRLLEAFEAEEDCDIISDRFEAQEYLQEKQNEEDDDWFEEKKTAIEALMAEFSQAG